MANSHFPRLNGMTVNFFKDRMLPVANGQEYYIFFAEDDEAEFEIHTVSSDDVVEIGKVGDRHYANCKSTEDENGIITIWFHEVMVVKGY